MPLIPTIVCLADLVSGEQGDCFVLLAAKERSQTRDGKPYYRVGFRDARRTATSMIWSDTAWFADCESKWTVGEFYKLRCSYSESQYGPQIEIDRIRVVETADRQQGFDPDEFYDRSRFDREEMFADLTQIARTQITEEPLSRLVLGLLEKHADLIKRMSAAARNHHSYVGGFVEHVLSVTRTAVYLADKYADYYPEMQPPLSKSLVVAGAILHDIGKTVELDHLPSGADYTAAGRLIGHILLGRDMIREQAREIPDLNPESLLRLEHIIVSHHNLPEWGSPIPPSTPEALLVSMADDIDAKFNMIAKPMTVAPQPGEQFTSRDNPLRRQFFRGL